VLEVVVEVVVEEEVVRWGGGRRSLAPVVMIRNSTARVWG
jgi:hypothetical protein